MNPDPEVARRVRAVYQAARNLDLAEFALHVAAAIYVMNGSLYELTATAAAFVEAQRAKTLADQELNRYVPVKATRSDRVPADSSSAQRSGANDAEAHKAKTSSR